MTESTTTGNTISTTEDVAGVDDDALDAAVLARSSPTDPATAEPKVSLLLSRTRRAKKSLPEVAPTPRKAQRSDDASRRSGRSKADIVLKKLQSAKGATVAQLGEATGWQSHSVRGFLSAAVRKKLGLTLVSETGRDGQRRYRIVDGDRGQAG